MSAIQHNIKLDFLHHTAISTQVECDIHLVQ